MRDLRHGEVICIDTHIVIWGIKKESSPHDQPFIEKAAHFLQKCSDLKIKVVIPSIVLGEALSGCDDSSRTDFLDYVQNRYIVVPYDAIAAYYFSELWRKRESLKKSKGHVKQINITRDALKADFMIIATAVAQQASCIYTNEVKTFKSFAGESILIEPLPSFSKQLNLDVQKD